MVVASRACSRTGLLSFVDVFSTTSFATHGSDEVMRFSWISSPSVYFPASMSCVWISVIMSSTIEPLKRKSLIDGYITYVDCCLKYCGILGDGQGLQA